MTIWTNVDDFTRVDLAMTATYTPPTITRDTEHYVTDFKVGLAEMKYSLELYEGTCFIINQGFHRFLEDLNSVQYFILTPNKVGGIYESSCLCVCLGHTL